MKKFKIQPLPRLGALLKSSFMSGLLVVIPMGVITWLALAVLRKIWRLHEILPEDWRPENILTDIRFAHLLNLFITIGIALLLAFAISLVGWISKQVMGRKLLEWVGEFIQRIPVLRTIYSALDQLLRTLTAEGGKQFSRVVYVEYPRAGCWTLAFVTGSSEPWEKDQTYLSLYVPTTPNPTSGFYLLVAESEVRESHLSVEEAFKTILSLGMVNPHE